MTPAQQERRAIIQARCVLRYARVKDLEMEAAWALWCCKELGLAKQWAEFYDQGETK